MARRLDLQVTLEGVLGSDHVYFQPPPTMRMQYPCIVYRWDTNNSTFADNKVYRTLRKYTVIVIDLDPDSVIPDKVLGLPLCKKETNYTVDNLYHYPFTLYH